MAPQQHTLPYGPAARPSRPGPTENESPASQPLHHLGEELGRSQKAWEQLGTRIALGYDDALQRYTDTLDEMSKRDQEVSNDGLSFILSFVCVGFAGGLVGGVLAPWVRASGISAARSAFRNGVSGIGQQAAKNIAKAGTEKISDTERSNNDPYKSVATSGSTKDLVIRDLINSAFGPVYEALDAMIAEANRINATASAGQEILNRFRIDCPLLRDKPFQNDLPSVKDVSRAAQLALWVSWAQEYGPRWTHIYQQLDFWHLMPEKRELRQDRSSYGQNPQSIKEVIKRLSPLERKMLELDKWREVYDSVLMVAALRGPNFEPVLAPITEHTNIGNAGDSFTYIDLRKLAQLPLNDVSLPFQELLQTGLKWGNLNLRNTSLSKIEAVKPYFKKHATQTR